MWQGLWTESLDGEPDGLSGTNTPPFSFLFLLERPGGLKSASINDSSSDELFPEVGLAPSSCLFSEKNEFLGGELNGQRRSSSRGIRGADLLLSFLCVLFLERVVIFRLGSDDLGSAAVVSSCS
jgi:hypothetical protein